jgi:hypothetical protein
MKFPMGFFRSCFLLDLPWAIEYVLRWIIGILFLFYMKRGMDEGKGSRGSFL